MPRLTPEIESVSPYDTATVEVELSSGVTLLIIADQFEQGDVFFTFDNMSQLGQKFFGELQRAAIMRGAVGHPSPQHRDAVRKWLTPSTTTPLQIYRGKDDPTIVVGKGMYVRIPDTVISRKVGKVQSIASARSHKD